MYRPSWELTPEEYERRRKEEEERRQKMRRGKIGGIAIGVVIALSLLLLVLCSVRVPAGYVAVQYDLNGGVRDKVLTQGWHLISPTVHTTKYTVGIEQSYLTKSKKGDSEDNERFTASSKEGKAIAIDLTFTYQYKPEDVKDVFVRFKGQSGKEVRDSFIKPNIISWTKEVTAKYPVTEILGDERANLNIALSEYIREKFDPYGIIIENVSLIDIDADQETRASVQRKVNAQQELELAQIEQKTANVQAQKDKEVALIKAEQDKETAQIAAEQAKIKAEGEAEAIRIKAEAEAEANKMIAESLTPELIENNKTLQWNGVEPLVVGSGATIVDVGSVINPTENVTE